ncbi:MAG TPA: FHA domain-containing protein, partial [Gemmatimonadaceae bacterium]|nr:FHA domain-containing protein [Gemmatimonadaceae bacterium]
GATGTILNGAPVTSPHLLAEGDTIGIGDTTFRFTRQRPDPDVVIVAPPDGDEDHVPRATSVDALSRQPTVVNNRLIEPDPGLPDPTVKRRRVSVAWMIAPPLILLALLKIYLIVRHGHH